MSKWLAIFSNAEFTVDAVNIHEAKKAVIRKAETYGLKRGQHFELYRLGGANYGIL